MIRSLRKSILLERMGSYIAENLKNRSHIILRLWTEHCEYILAQKCRRGQQMISLYTKLWDDRALRELLYRLRKQVHRHAAKGFSLSSVGLCVFDWDSQRISIESMKQHLDEIDFIRKLEKATIVCNICQRRKVIDKKVDDVKYCSCKEESIKCPVKTNRAGGGSNNNSTKISSNCESFDEWKPYLERKNMVIWRREERPGLYVYKVYASYPDVTAEDFLHVQIDVNYRKIWDKTAVTLDVVDTDPVNKYKSHIVYWEMLWPKFFANRDYVFNRRYLVDRQRKVIVIANKSIEHSSCPVKANNQRVKDYWSYMVIKSTSTNFRKPGLEYVLTYFDNPGIVLPPTVTSWVAQKQMPDFLNKLYVATVEYAKTRVLEDEETNIWDNFPDPGFEYPPDPIPENWRDQPDDDDNNFRQENNNTIEQDDIDMLDDGEIDPPTKWSWWTYLLPHRYFIG